MVVKGLVRGAYYSVYEVEAVFAVNELLPVVQRADKLVPAFWKSAETAHSPQFVVDCRAGLVNPANNLVGFQKIIFPSLARKKLFPHDRNGVAVSAVGDIFSLARHFGKFYNGVVKLLSDNRP